MWFEKIYRKVYIEVGDQKFISRSSEGLALSKRAGWVVEVLSSLMVLPSEFSRSSEDTSRELTFSGIPTLETLSLDPRQSNNN